MTEPSEHARRAAEKYSYAFHPGFSSDERLRLIQGIIEAATAELKADKERLDRLQLHVMASGTVARGWKLYFYSPHHGDIREAIDAAFHPEQKEK